MSEECKYCKTSQTCLEMAEYGSIYCLLHRRIPRVIEKTYDELQQENRELKKRFEEKENQQKEFIEYLEKEIEALEFCDNEFILSNHKKEVKAYKEILLKYKEIIDTDINVGERGDDK